MNRLNWDFFGGEWTFDYRANVLDHVYSEETVLNCPQDEVVITGVTASFTIFCEEDYLEIRNWMETGSKLVSCPMFYRAPVTIEDVTSSIDATTKAIMWSNSPYKFTGVYFTGLNSDANFNIIDTTQPCQWSLDICPINRDFGYYQPSEKNPVTIDPIPFFVRPRLF